MQRENERARIWHGHWHTACLITRVRGSRRAEWVVGKQGGSGACGLCAAPDVRCTKYLHFFGMKVSTASRRIGTLDSRSFDAVIKHGVVLVDFWQPWCRTCRLQMPVLERVAERLGDRAKVAVINVDDARLKAVDYRVQSISTLVLFEEGQPIRTIVGRPSEGEIVAELESAVSHRNASKS